MSGKVTAIDVLLCLYPERNEFWHHLFALHSREVFGIQAGRGGLGSVRVFPVVQVHGPKLSNLDSIENFHVFLISRCEVAPKDGGYANAVFTDAIGQTQQASFVRIGQSETDSNVRTEIPVVYLDTQELTSLGRPYHDRVGNLSRVSCFEVAPNFMNGTVFDRV